MKARVPAIRKVNNKEFRAMQEVATTQVRHAAYRVYLVACLTLRQEFGFGDSRMARFVDALSDNLMDYGGWAACDVADHKLFDQCEKAGSIIIEEKVKKEMLEYENKRFTEGMKK